jgi:hypothetical protein
VIRGCDFTSDFLWRLVACLDDGATHVDHNEQNEADGEEDDQRGEGAAVARRKLQCKAKQKRSEPARAALANLVEAEVLRLLSLWDHVREQRPGERLATSEYDPDESRKQVELRDRTGLKEVSARNRAGPQDKARQHDPFGTEETRERAEQERPEERYESVAFLVTASR